MHLVLHTLLTNTRVLLNVGSKRLVISALKCRGAPWRGPKEIQGHAGQEEWSANQAEVPTASGYCACLASDLRWPPEVAVSVSRGAL